MSETLRRVAAPRRLVPVCVIVGLLFAGLPYDCAVESLAGSILLGGTLAAVAWSLVDHRPGRIVGSVAVLGFAPWLAIRSSPWLIAIDVLMMFALGWHALTMRVGVSPFRSAGGYLAQWVDGVPAAFAGPGIAVRLGRSMTPSSRLWSRRLRSGARIAVLPGLLVVIVLALLASGDELFASYLDIKVPDSVVGRAALGAFGVAVVIAAVGVASRPDHGTDFGSRELEVNADRRGVALALGGLGICLLAFGAVQLSGAVLGADFVASRTGLTHAEWARSGFFQLVAVAAIAAGVIGLAATAIATTDTAWRMRLQVLSGVVGAGVLALVVASIIKLLVYSDQFGLTMLRVYTITFAGWIGVVALMQLAAVIRPGGRWLAAGVLASVVVGAFAMNVVNPEPMVVAHNIDRLADGRLAPPVGGVATEYDRLDVAYIGTLSADATAPVLARIDELPAELRAELMTVICATPGDANWLNFNAARRAARQAIARTC